MRGEKKEGKEEVMQRHTLATSHQQTDAQLVSEQWLFWKDFPPVLLLSMMLYGMEYPFGWFGSAVSSVSLPSLLPTPSLLAEGRE